MTPSRPGERGMVAVFGPDPDTTGGMASVIALSIGLPLARYRLIPIRTWAPSARLWSTGPFLQAGGRIVANRLRRQFDVAHFHLSERGSFVREGALVQLARRSGVATVVTLHGADFPRFADERPALCRRVLASADRVVCLGPATAAIVEHLLGSVAAIETIPNPVELPDRVTAPAGRTAVFGGETSRRKGVDTLLAAWPLVAGEVPDAELVVAGPEGDVVLSPTTGVRFVGPQRPAEVMGLIDSARVAVLPSRAEVMPMFLLEAMARARPVISTPVGEIPSLPIVASALVAPGDPEALAQALIARLTDDRRAEEEGAVLRHAVEAAYSPAAVATRLDGVYDAVRGGRSAQRT